ncbi:hypothetical protein Q1695_003561 [Nippostrongylus brasiliensis]|nr:hypothetical protein Q1695_003561 [Nippostrongylus brasiliensis]
MATIVFSLLNWAERAVRAMQVYFVAPASSVFCKELPQKTESSVKNFPIGGDLGGEGPVNYHILSDGGFAQKTWMQMPFRQPDQADHPDRQGSVRRDARWHVPEASPDNRIARFLNLIDRVVGKMTLEHAVSQISNIDAVSALKISSTGWIIAASGLSWSHWCGMDCRDVNLAAIVAQIKTAVSGGMEVPRVSANTPETVMTVSELGILDVGKIDYATTPWLLVSYTVEKCKSEIHGDIKVGDDYGTTRVSGQNSGPMYGYKITRIPDGRA